MVLSAGISELIMRPGESSLDSKVHDGQISNVWPLKTLMFLTETAGIAKASVTHAVTNY